MMKFSQCWQWLIIVDNAKFSKELTSHWWQFLIKKKGIDDNIKIKLKIELILINYLFRINHNLNLKTSSFRLFSINNIIYVIKFYVHFI